MGFKLGTESVRTISDGGLGVRYVADDGWTNFQPGGIRPVLAVEVSFSRSCANQGRTAFTE